MANLLNSVAKAKRTFRHLFTKAPRNASTFPRAKAIEPTDAEEIQVARPSPRSVPEHIQNSADPSSSTRDTPDETADVRINQESVSEDLEPRLMANPDRQPRSERTIPWLNTVKLTLELFEKTLNSVPAPGLRGVIGGILKIMERYDVSILVYIIYIYYQCPEIIQIATQNKKDLEELKESVDKLNALFAVFVGTSALPMPSELEQQLKTVSKYVSFTTS
jgi:hypothetical protein